MIWRICFLVSAFAFLAGCGETYRHVWHEETLSSGAKIKVTSFNLVWGAEHDDHALGGDCFSIEYVVSDPGADVQHREAEAALVFELLRPVSEQWAFSSAQMLAFPTLERRGRYDLYLFERQADGHWSSKRTERKVFATD